MKSKFNIERLASDDPTDVLDRLAKAKVIEDSPFGIHVIDFTKEDFWLLQQLFCHMGTTKGDKVVFATRADEDGWYQIRDSSKQKIKKIKVRRKRND